MCKNHACTKAYLVMQIELWIHLDLFPVAHAVLVYASQQVGVVSICPLAVKVSLLDLVAQCKPTTDVEVDMVSFRCKYVDGELNLLERRWTTMIYTHCLRSFLSVGMTSTSGLRSLID